jgi:exopolysaccharide biosynthesis polyprenyl glycosylphosphotransferase
MFLFEWLLGETQLNASGIWRRLAVWALDLVCVAISLFCAIEIRFAGAMTTPEIRTEKNVMLILLAVVTFLDFATRSNRGFMKRTAGKEFGIILKYNFFLIVGVALLSGSLRLRPSPSRLMFLYFIPINIFVMEVGRTLAKAIARRVLVSERLGASIVMMVSPSMRERLERSFDTGYTYSIQGWLEYVSGHVSGKVFGRDISTSLDGLPTALSDVCDQINDVFICVPEARNRDLMALLDVGESLGANCHVALDLFDPSMQGATLGRFGGYPTVTYSGRGSKVYRKYIKRAIDVVVSLLVTIVAIIPGAILAVIISLQSKGAPFYSQERLGLNGRHFKLLKFRSMVADADDVEKYFTPEQLDEWERERKVDDDPRVTSVGRFLRKTSLDEFPQFLNVLKGDMSIVGPRPIVDDELVHYGDRAEEFLSCKPGVTGWWQVEARNDADYTSGSRQDLEIYYVRHQSFVLDWNIFKRTFGAVFHGTGQ